MKTERGGDADEIKRLREHRKDDARLYVKACETISDLEARLAAAESLVVARWTQERQSALDAILQSYIDRITSERDEALQQLAVAKADYAKAAESYAGICQTLDESGKKRSELEERLAEAEAELYAVSKWANDAQHTLDELFTLVQRIENLVQDYRQHEAKQAGGDL